MLIITNTGQLNNSYRIGAKIPPIPTTLYTDTDERYDKNNTTKITRQKKQTKKANKKRYIFYMIWRLGTPTTNLL